MDSDLLLCIFLQLKMVGRDSMTMGPHGGNIVGFITGPHVPHTDIEWGLRMAQVPWQRQ